MTPSTPWRKIIQLSIKKELDRFGVRRQGSFDNHYVKLVHRFEYPWITQSRYPHGFPEGLLAESAKIIQWLEAREGEISWRYLLEWQEEQESVSPRMERYRHVILHNSNDTIMLLRLTI